MWLLIQSWPNVLFPRLHFSFSLFFIQLYSLFIFSAYVFLLLFCKNKCIEFSRFIWTDCFSFQFLLQKPTKPSIHLCTLFHSFLPLLKRESDSIAILWVYQPLRSEYTKIKRTKEINKKAKHFTISASSSVGSVGPMDYDSSFLSYPPPPLPL